MKNIIKTLSLVTTVLFFVAPAFAQTDTLKKDTIVLNEIRILPNQTPEIIFPAEQKKGGGASNKSQTAAPAGQSLVSGSSDAGRTVGSLDVSPSGASTYTVPIAVPPGINGVVPKMSLTYNSQGGNGVAGYGWNISGASTITRLPATRFHDNVVGGVNLNMQDRYALDGQRLILKSGIYGANGAEYQTENYSNIRIVSRGTTSIGPDHFDVYYPDGSYAGYGLNNNSKTPTEYAVSYSDNPQGIRINYTYLIDWNTLSISNISYGAKGAGTAINNVNFVYKDRQRPEQAYVGGNILYRSKILSEINVVGNGTNYRNYVLTHNTVDGLNYERVINIQELSGDRSKSFEPIIITYNATYPTLDVTSINGLGVTGIGGDNARMLTSDFTGNGKMDFIVYPITKDKLWVFLDPTTSPLSKLGEQINPGSFDEAFSVSSLGSDNKLRTGQGVVLVKQPDATTINFDTYVTGFTSALTLNNQKQWSGPTLGYSYYSDCLGTYVTGPKIPRSFFSGDFNGDGLTDIIAVNTPYQYITRERFTSPGSTDCVREFANMSTSTVNFINLDRRVTSGFVNQAGNLLASYTGSDKILTADFNGDGKTDILHIATGVMYVYQLDAGNNLSLLWQTSDSRINNTYQALLGDYNGDGKMDVMFPTSDAAPGNTFFAVFSSTGTGFFKNERTYPFTNLSSNWDGTTLRLSTLIANDVNGDGKADIIASTTYTKNSGTEGIANVSIYSNMGPTEATGAPVFTRTATTNQTNLNLIHYPIPLFFTSSEPNFDLEYALISNNSIKLFTHEKDLKIESPINSVYQDGIQHFIDYKILAEGNYADGLDLYVGGDEQTYPNININLAPGLRVVSKVRRTFNNAELMQVFGYRRAVMNTEGLGFLGFSEIIRSNPHVSPGDGNRLFTISVNSPQLRGALLRTFTSKSADIGSTIKNTPVTVADITVSAPVTNAQTVVAANSITLSPGFTANGANGNFVAQITNPATGISDGGTISDYITRTDYTYKTELLSNKVFINMPLSVTTKDLLNGTNTLDTYTYDSYYNTTKMLTNSSGVGTKTTDATFDNNPSGNYIGRPLTQKTTLTNGGDTYSSEEQYAYTGFLPTQIKSRGNSTPFITENLLYDTYGNVTSKTLVTANGSRTTLMQYDASGRFVTKSTDTEELETNSTYNAANGNLLTKTNPYNQATTYAYDSWGRLAQTTDYLGANSYRTYQRSGYDIVISETDDEGREKVTTSNAVGNTTNVVSKDVLGQMVGKGYQYDIYDRKTGDSEPGIGSYTQWNTTEYDEYGRIRQATSFTGKTSIITYNGLVTTVNDGTKSVITTKNALGDIVSTQDPGGTINNTYFANGSLKSADLGGSAQSVEQDGWGRRTRLVDPSAGVYTYAYNDFGEITTETTPKGNTTYTYDVNGKVQTKHIQGDYTNMTYQYTYDGTTKLLTAMSLANADGNNAAYTYTYDGNKRPATTVEDNLHARFAKTLTYDTYGRIATETSEAKNKRNNIIVSKVILNHYQYGQLKNISDNTTGVSIWEVSAMNARGQVTQSLLGANIRETNQFDTYGFAQEYKTERVTGSAAELMKLTYNFDAQRENLSSRSNTAFSWNESFTHDNMDRLTGFTDNNGGQTQNYDGQGRINNNSRLGNYVYTGNSYLQTGLNSLTPFAAYHYQNHPLLQISYNALKAPVEINEDGKERISFQYNASESRAHMYYGSTNADMMLRPFRRHYSEDGSMEITEDIANSKTSFILYLGGDAYTAPAIWKHEQTSSTTTANLYYLHRDYLGSIMMITDVNGAVKEKRQFDAWGNIVKLTDGNGNALAAFVILDRGYTGHEHLLGVGLINMNGRLYDPLLHRFLSPDNNIQDLFNSLNYNRFGYVLNSPLKHTDVSGEFIPLLVFIGAAVLGGGGNVWSNWDKIKKNPWSALGYFASGAAGGAVAVVNPWLGGSITAGGNVVTDLASGNMPKFNNLWDVGKYVGGTALDGLQAMGAAGLSKWGYKVAGNMGWIQTVTHTGTEHIVAIGTNGFAVDGATMAINNTKIPFKSLAEAGAGFVAEEVSVIGPRATYREFAQKIGANFLNVTDETWTMRKNVEFLQGVAKRGDDVIFAGKFNPLKLDPNSVLGQEIRYLTKRGYSWTDDFSRLIKK